MLSASGCAVHGCHIADTERLTARSRPHIRARRSRGSRCAVRAGQLPRANGRHGAALACWPSEMCSTTVSEEGKNTLW